MPTPNQLRLASMRDSLATQDFVVHEVVDVEPTSSDSEYEADEGDVVNNHGNVSGADAGFSAVDVRGINEEVAENRRRELQIEEERRKRERGEAIETAGGGGGGGGGGSAPDCVETDTAADPYNVD